MSDMIVLSHFQARELEQARKRGATSALISLDLGLSTAQVSLEQDRVILTGENTLSWQSLDEIGRSETICFVIEDNHAFKIEEFSESLNRYYSLMPTTGAPTMLISGILMHRIKGIDPHRDTLKKLQTIAPLAGRVLDTCTGLGYTAIQSAKTAQEVITIELDPTALKIASQNPWSQSLFGNPRIRQITGDSFDEIQTLEDGSFARIIHDPPVFSLAGDLYSGQFYRELYRVLERRGRVFHYIGDLKSRSGSSVAKGVVRRLGESGFERVVRKPGAFGVVAYKS